MFQTRRKRHVVLRASFPAAAVFLCLAFLEGCSLKFETDENPVFLPAPESPTPVPRAQTDRMFRAGFGRADITPPPGLGLYGYGPEGKRATGHRLRLYARALIMEDARGERIAFVVVELDAVSTILQRLVAEEVVGATGIGADRLILAATHTHTAPGHFLDAGPHNDAGSQVQGYDPAVVNFLVSRIAEALREAHGSLAPARIAWGQREIPARLIRNRSMAAYNRNLPFQHPPGTRPASPPNATEFTAVDPVWTMLRVDTTENGRVFAPAGAFSVLAVHGTGNPSATDVYDGDVPGLIARALEVRIDSINGHPKNAFEQRAEHVFANGALGDVSPALPRAPDPIWCPMPNMLRARRPGGPQTPSRREEWRAPSKKKVAECLAYARDVVNTLTLGRGGTVLQLRSPSFGTTAFELFKEIIPTSSNVTISRAFETLSLTDGGAPFRLCPPGKIGTAAAAGASDRFTRFRGWRLLGLIRLGITEGGPAIAHRPGCQQPKRVLFYPVQSLAVGKRAFPEAAPLAVVRITIDADGGPRSLLIGAVPVEPTTLAGKQMKDAMLKGADFVGLGVDDVALMGLANGYVDYVTTREEYSAQPYQGGSNIYGAETATVLSTRLRTLTESLNAPDGPIVHVGPVSPSPGARETVFPFPLGPHPPRPTGIAVTCERNARADPVVVSWTDLDPGALLPSDGQMLSLTQRRGGRIVARAFDNHAKVVVRAKERRERGHLWEARWTPDTPVNAGDVIDVFLERWPVAVPHMGMRVTFSQSPSRTISRASGSFLADGWVAGDRVEVLGTAKNNRIFTVLSVTATVITVGGASLTDEGPVAGVTLTRRPSDGSAGC